MVVSSSNYLVHNGIVEQSHPVCLSVCLRSRFSVDYVWSVMHVNVISPKVREKKPRAAFNLYKSFTISSVQAEISLPIKVRSVHFTSCRGPGLECITAGTNRSLQ